MSGGELPATSDFYALESVLDDDDRAFVRSIRAFMQAEVAPIINDYWSREEFPHQIFPRVAELGVGGMALEGYGCAGRGVLVDGFVAMELAAVDCSVATGPGSPPIPGRRSSATSRLPCRTCAAFLARPA